MAGKEEISKVLDYLKNGGDMPPISQYTCDESTIDNEIIPIVLEYGVPTLNSKPIDNDCAVLPIHGLEQLVKNKIAIKGNDIAHRYLELIFEIYASRMSYTFNFSMKEGWEHYTNRVLDLNRHVKSGAMVGNIGAQYVWTTLEDDTLTKAAR